VRSVIFADEHNPMEMIRHDHKIARLEFLADFRRPQPFPFDDSSALIQVRDSIGNRFKQAFLVVGA
jgi:hypothetical protein